MLLAATLAATLAVAGGSRSVRAPAPRCAAAAASETLSRHELRERRRRTRLLAAELSALDVQGSVAVEYAECLTAKGIHSAADICGVDQGVLEACSIHGLDRQRLLAFSRLAALEQTAPAPTSASASSPADGDAGSVGDAGSDPRCEGEGGGDTLELLVPDSLDGSRVDAALAALLPPLSRSYFGGLAADGHVLVGGGRVKKARAVSPPNLEQARPLGSPQRAGAGLRGVAGGARPRGRLAEGVAARGAGAELGAGAAPPRGATRGRARCSAQQASRARRPPGARPLERHPRPRPPTPHAAAADRHARLGPRLSLLRPAPRRVWLGAPARCGAPPRQVHHGCHRRGQDCACAAAAHGRLCGEARVEGLPRRLRRRAAQPRSDRRADRPPHHGPPSDGGAARRRRRRARGALGRAPDRHRRPALPGRGAPPDRPHAPDPSPPRRCGPPGARRPALRRRQLEPARGAHRSQASPPCEGAPPRSPALGRVAARRRARARRPRRLWRPPRRRVARSVRRVGARGDRRRPRRSSR
mmetsp:Transcript_28691/g.84078  ORF Transcript_28691/g.84078 Transcript_28691/m.84078 type:complete len:530 (-) Transcript_28691:1401-2990(-)